MSYKASEMFRLKKFWWHFSLYCDVDNEQDKYKIHPLTEYIILQRKTSVHMTMISHKSFFFLSKCIIDVLSKAVFRRCCVKKLFLKIHNSKFLDYQFGLWIREKCAKLCFSDGFQEFLPVKLRFLLEKSYSAGSNLVIMV